MRCRVTHGPSFQRALGVLRRKLGITQEVAQPFPLWPIAAPRRGTKDARGGTTLGQVHLRKAGGRKPGRPCAEECLATSPCCRLGLQGCKCSGTEGTALSVGCLVLQPFWGVAAVRFGEPRSTLSSIAAPSDFGKIALVV